jgi:hypothetical protein
MGARQTLIFGQVGQTCRHSRTPCMTYGRSAAVSACVNVGYMAACRYIVNYPDGGSAPFSTCRWTYLLPFTDTRFVPQDEASNPRIDRALWVLACLFSAHEPCSRKLITANAAP